METITPDLQNVIGQRIMKINKDRKGTKIISKKQVGYLIAGVVDNHIAIGYSMCHKNDDYDVIDGQRRPGFGRVLAYKRAVKWANEGIIEVPPGIKSDVSRFLERCKKYYKGLEPQAVHLQWWGD
jgi:hypothetical protein